MKLRIQLVSLNSYSTGLRTASGHIVIKRFEFGRVYDDISHDGLVHEDVCAELLDPDGQHAGKFQLASAKAVEPKDEAAALVEKLGGVDVLKALLARLEEGPAAEPKAEDPPAAVVEVEELDADDDSPPPQPPEEKAAEPAKAPPQRVAPVAEREMPSLGAIRDGGKRSESASQKSAREERNAKRKAAKAKKK